jgi:protein kinase A
VNLSKRLGNLSDGVADIKKHRWFHSIEWMDLLNCKCTPPFVPFYRNLGDDHNFDLYEEEPLCSGSFCIHSNQFSEF